jgi:thiol-disulfide isomerase/thioredoxin
LSKLAPHSCSNHLVWLLVSLALSALCLGACTNQKQNDQGATSLQTGPPNTLFPMPPLEPRSGVAWVLADGKRVTPGDFRGQVLVLDFYATWCVPCRESIPHLNSLMDNYGKKGLQVVGLNVGGPDDRIKVADFAKELKVQYPLGFPDKSLTDLFLADNQTIPQTFVFGREGHLLKRFVGYDPTTGVELEQVVAGAVNAKP